MHKNRFYFSLYPPTVFRFHFTNIRVDFPIRAAGGSGVPPAGFATMACRLAVFLVGPHYTLTVEFSFVLNCAPPPLLTKTYPHVSSFIKHVLL